MKRIEIKPGRIIETPWLRIEEAAAYCGISRTAFEDRAMRVPRGGDAKLPLFNCDVLDKWMAGELSDIPFARDTEAAAARRNREDPAEEAPGELNFLIDPETGVVHRPGRIVPAATAATK
jgi:hypothetical protein